MFIQVKNTNLPYSTSEPLISKSPRELAISRLFIMKTSFEFNLSKMSITWQKKNINKSFCLNFFVFELKEKVFDTKIGKRKTSFLL